MTPTKPTSDMTVAEVLEQWPETVTVFQDYKTACIGCSMAPFDTMVDVAREYDLALSQIMGDLRLVVDASGQSGGQLPDRSR